MENAGGCDPRLDAAAEEEERADMKERRRVRTFRRIALCGWIRDRLDLANYPLPSASCTAVIADCLERGRIFGQPLTGTKGRWPIIGALTAAPHSSFHWHRTSHLRLTEHWLWVKFSLELGLSCIVALSFAAPRGQPW